MSVLVNGLSCILWRTSLKVQKWKCVDPNPGLLMTTQVMFNVLIHLEQNVLVSRTGFAGKSHPTLLQTSWINYVYSKNLSLCIDTVGPLHVIEVTKDSGMKCLAQCKCSVKYLFSPRPSITVAFFLENKFHRHLGIEGRCGVILPLLPDGM